MTGGKATKHIVETIAKVIFLVCAAVAIVAVLSITVYMFAKGTPALAKVGVIDLLFGTVWQPTAATPSYGILYIILTSIIGTAVAILIGVPIGILTAVFITEVANKKLAAIVQPAVEQSSFCDYCAGNYDSANRDKHQCFFDPCSTWTFKVGFSCTWGNTYPDDI